MKTTEHNPGKSKAASERTSTAAERLREPPRRASRVSPPDSGGELLEVQIAWEYSLTGGRALCTGADCSQACGNAVVDAAQRGGNTLDRHDHSQRDRGDNQCVFDKILTVSFFPKTIPKL